MTSRMIPILALAFLFGGCNPDDRMHEKYRRSQAKAVSLYRSYKASQQQGSNASVVSFKGSLPKDWAVYPGPQKAIDESNRSNAIEVAFVNMVSDEQPVIWFFASEFSKKVVVPSGTDTDLFVDWVLHDCEFYGDYVIGIKSYSSHWKPVDSSLVTEDNRESVIHYTYSNGSEEWMRHDKSGNLMSREIHDSNGKTLLVDVITDTHGVIIYARQRDGVSKSP